MEVSCVTVASPSLKTRGSGYSCASGETSPPETAGGSRRRLTAKRRRLILPTYVNRICHDYTRGSGVGFIRNLQNASGFGFARPCFTHRLHDGNCRKGIGPADVEGEMCNDFPGLSLRKAVIHGPVEVVGYLRDLACRDQRADGDEASVSWRKARPKPKIPEQNVGRILHEPRHHGTRLLLDASGALRLGLLVQRKGCDIGGRKLVGSDAAPGKNLFGDRSGRYGVTPRSI